MLWCVSSVADTQTQQGVASLRSAKTSRWQADRQFGSIFI
jgi:hypothetical protein